MHFSTVTTVLTLLTLTTALPSADVDSRAASPEPNNPGPIPTCTNGGTPLCCQGTFAGDLPTIITLAGLSGYQLNPNDVNCIGTSPASASCVGVNTCCQVTGLVSLFTRSFCWAQL